MMPAILNILAITLIVTSVALSWWLKKHSAAWKVALLGSTFALSSAFIAFSQN